MGNTVVLFHANCLDGTGAKYAAWMKFGDKATYIPVQYGEVGIPKDLDGTFGKDVYILDFSYPRDVLLKLKEFHNVVVIDHHKTAEAALEGVPDCIFDMTKSGAVLAWEYFHGKKKIPQILLHVQDRDLWKWELEGTKEITTGLSTLGGSMVEWNTTNCAQMKQVGAVLCKYIDSKVDSATKEDRVRFVNLNFQGKNYKVGIVNTTGYASEICQAIYTKYEVDFAMSYFIEVNNIVALSFRSNGSNPEVVDVSEIASAFSGGGHKNAAGGRAGLATLEKLLNGNLSIGIIGR